MVCGLSCSVTCWIFLDQGSWSHVPCIGRWIPNPCATRESLDGVFVSKKAKINSSERREREKMVVDKKWRERNGKSFVDLVCWMGEF